jgi:CheY-like chemotaxis protein
MPRAGRLRERTQKPDQAKRRHVTVLVVDDKEADLKKASVVLETLGMSALAASSSAEALQLVGSRRIDVALIDWRLRDQNDGMALGGALWRQYHIPFVLFSAYLDPRATNRAHLLGAAYVIEKPLGASTLQAALQIALRRRSNAAGADGILPITIAYGSNSASQRWTEIVLTALRADKDPSTEAAMAEANIIITSVYRRACEASDVNANDTTDLARFLRAEARSIEDGSTLRSHMGIRHSETRAKLFEKAGLPTDSRFVPLRQFLLNQKFISTDKECFRELAHQLANHPLFFVEPDDEQTGTDDA